MHIQATSVCSDELRVCPFKRTKVRFSYSRKLDTRLGDFKVSRLFRDDPMIIAFVSNVALPGTSIIEEAPEHP
jgi:hypothetical protein